MDEESDNQGVGGESSLTSGADQDFLKLQRQFLEDELNYRRTHRWNIFSWASGLLLGGIGGLFAITRLGGPPPQTCALIKPKFVLIGAIVIFSIYSSFWLGHHYKREQCAKKNLDEIYKTLKLKPTEPSKDWPLKELSPLSAALASDALLVLLLGAVAFFVALFT